MVPFPEAEGPSMAMTGTLTRSVPVLGSCRDGLKDLEIIRKRLGDAVRVVDAHRHTAERHEREAHCHPVIIISIDLGIGLEFSWIDFQEVRTFLDLRAELAQLGR